VCTLLYKKRGLFHLGRRFFQKDEKCMAVQISTRKKLFFLASLQEVENENEQIVRFPLLSSWFQFQPVLERRDGCTFPPIVHREI
jgi:hypothetical protein